MSLRLFVTAPGIQSVLKTLPRYAVRFTTTFQPTGPTGTFDDKVRISTSCSPYGRWGQTPSCHILL